MIIGLEGDIVNNKGQALIEFVLILPIFIFLLFAVYDFGMIFSAKNTLESSTSDIIDLYKEGNDIMQLKTLYKDLEIAIDNDNDYVKITFKDSLKLITPGFNRIFGNPYSVKVERYIPNEQ